MTIDGTYVERALIESDALARDHEQAALRQDRICDELLGFAAHLDSLEEFDPNLRDTVDHALQYNNALAEHHRRAVVLQKRVCDDLLDMVPMIEEANAEPEPPERILFPYEPTGEDQTQQLVDWVHSLPPNIKVSFGSDLGRTYVVNSIFDIYNFFGLDAAHLAIQVTEDASGKDIGWDGQSKRRHIRFNDCDTITLHDIKVNGQNVTDDAGNPIDETGQARWDRKMRPFEHGMCFESCANLTITDYVVDAVFGDGAYFRDTDGFLVLDGFRVSRNGRQGIAIISASGELKILNGHIVHSRGSGIDLEPNVDREHINHVEIGHMKIKSRRLPITRGGQGTLGFLHIHDVEIAGSAVPRINVQGDHNEVVLVERIRSENEAGSPAPIVRIQRTDSVTLVDLDLPGKVGRNMVGVGLTDVGTADLTRCVFENAAVLYEDRTGDAVVSVVDCSPVG